MNLTLKILLFKELFFRDSIFPVEYSYDSIKIIVEKNVFEKKVSSIKDEFQCNIKIASKKQKLDFERRHKIIKFNAEDCVYVLRVKRGCKARKFQFNRYTKNF